MEALDWLVIGVFFLALIGIIVWVVRQKQNDSADYFLGGRDATWLAIGASIFASNILLPKFIKKIYTHMKSHNL